MNIAAMSLAAAVLLAAPAAHSAQSIDQSLPTSATPKVEVSIVQGKADRGGLGPAGGRARTARGSR